MPLEVGQPVETRPDHRAKARRGGERACGQQPLSRQHVRALLEEERVPGCGLEHRLKTGGLDAAEKLGDERLALGRGERRQRHDQAPVSAGDEGRLRVGRLRPGRAEDEQRTVGRLEKPDQLDERRVGPVQVFERQDDRSVGHKLERAPDSPVELALRDPFRHRLRPRAEHGVERGVDRAQAVRLERRIGDCRGGPRRGQQLGDRSVRADLPVGQTPAPEDRCARALREGCEQSRLPGAGLREQDDRGRPAVVPDSPPLVLEHGQLARSPDERRIRVAARGRLPEPHRLPDLDRRGLAARGERVVRHVVDRVARRLVRGQADEDRARGGGRLGSRGGVHHVAHRDRLARGGKGAGPDESLAGGDADAHLERQPGVAGVQLADRVTDRERRP